MGGNAVSQVVKVLKDMSEADPIVSVVIPTYNRATLIGRAIHSVLVQTIDDWELIVVDDASTDNTEEVVSSFEDFRIRYYSHQLNRGGSAARNTGIQKARGKYVAFLDSDDEWLPTKLERQLRLLETEESGVGLVYTGMIHVYQSGERTKISPRHRGDLTGDLLLRNVVGSSSAVLARKTVLESTGGFDTDLPSRQDLDMWLRISIHYDIEYVESCDVVIHKDRERNRISLNDWGRCKGYLTLYRKHKDLLEREEKKSEYLCQMGRVFDVRSQRKSFISKCYLESIRSDPYYIKPYALLLILKLKEYLGKLIT